MESKAPWAYVGNHTRRPISYFPISSEPVIYEEEPLTKYHSIPHARVWRVTETPGQGVDWVRGPRRG